MNKIRVAHFAIFGPNQCGLYGTAKDMTIAEQSVGLDAGFVAFDSEYQGVHKDNGFETKDLQWAESADILVRHTAMTDRLHCSGKPLVMVMHGRPESSFRLEEEGKREVVTGLYSKKDDHRYKAFITFWPEYMEIMKHIINAGKLFYVPAPVDLDWFNPKNKPYDFGELGGKPNILISDIWREDVIPFNVLFAAAKFVEKNGGRIHMVGVGKEAAKPLAPFIVEMKKKNLLGLVYGIKEDIKSIYTACDMVITPHVIATRIVREALASGVPIVAGKGNRYTPYTANPMDVEAFENAIEECWNSPDKNYNPRKVAEDNFGFEQTGLKAKEIYEKILNHQVGAQRKVFVDVGGHLGQSVRRFYREVEDADRYEIFSFEPEPETFRKLSENIGHIKNVRLINAAAYAGQGTLDFYVGKDNQNEGGTTQKGKLTGRVDYDKPLKVPCLDFAKWLKENVKEEDFVVVKMNIEGGEYALMAHLLKEDVTGLIDKFYIQLHAHKFPQNEQRWTFNAIEEEFCKNAKCEVFMTNKGDIRFQL